MRFLSRFAICLGSLVLAISGNAQCPPQMMCCVQETSPYNYYYTPQSFDGYVYGEYLYWKPFNQDTFEWANNADQVFMLNYEWKSDFRLGAGVRFPENAWDCCVRPWQFEVVYTHYQSHESGTGSAGGAALNPRVPLAQLGITQGQPKTLAFNDGSAYINLVYNRFDAFFAWPVWFDQNVIWRFRLGGTGLWLKEEWHASFSDQLATVTPVAGANPGNVQSSHFFWKYRSGGLLGGTDASVALGHGFGLFADGSAALVVGSFDEDEIYEGSGTAPAPTSLRFPKRFFNLQTVFNFSAGIDYKNWFNCESWMLYLGLGYEITWLPSMNQFGRINLDENNLVGNFFTRVPTNMGLQGFRAKVGVEF